MTIPTRPMPALAESWIARSRYVRWADALIAWLLLVGVAAQLAPQRSSRLVVISVGLLVVGLMLRPLRIRGRPISGWIGLVVSRPLRPGDRAWFVREGRADAVLITARHGIRLSIAM